MAPVRRQVTARAPDQTTVQPSVTASLVTPRTCPALHCVWPNVRPALFKAACRSKTARRSQDHIETASRQIRPVTCSRPARALGHRRVADWAPRVLGLGAADPSQPFPRCFKRPGPPPLLVLRALVDTGRSVAEPAAALADCRLAFGPSTSYVRAYVSAQVSHGLG